MADCSERGQGNQEESLVVQGNSQNKDAPETLSSLFPQPTTYADAGVLQIPETEVPLISSTGSHGASGGDMEEEAMSSRPSIDVAAGRTDVLSSSSQGVGATDSPQGGEKMHLLHDREGAEQSLDTAAIVESEVRQACSTTASRPKSSRRTQSATPRQSRKEDRRARASGLKTNRRSSVKKQDMDETQKNEKREKEKEKNVKKERKKTRDGSTNESWKKARALRSGSSNVSGSNRQAEFTGFAASLPLLPVERLLLHTNAERDRAIVAEALKAEGVGPSSETRRKSRTKTNKTNTKAGRHARRGNRRPALNGPATNYRDIFWEDLCEDLCDAEIEECDVCGTYDNEEDDRIIYCDGCEIAVHQTCYAVKQIPTGNWYCLYCEAYRRQLDEIRGAFEKSEEIARNESTKLTPANSQETTQVNVKDAMAATTGDLSEDGGDARGEGGVDVRAEGGREDARQEGGAETRDGEEEERECHVRSTEPQREPNGERGGEDGADVMRENPGNTREEAERLRAAEGGEKGVVDEGEKGDHTADAAAAVEAEGERQLSRERADEGGRNVECICVQLALAARDEAEVETVPSKRQKTKGGRKPNDRQSSSHNSCGKTVDTANSNKRHSSSTTDNRNRNASKCGDNNDNASDSVSPDSCSRNATVDTISSTTSATTDATNSASSATSSDTEAIPDITGTANASQGAATNSPKARMSKKDNRSSSNGNKAAATATTDVNTSSSTISSICSKSSRGSNAGSRGHKRAASPTGSALGRNRQRQNSHAGVTASSGGPLEISRSVFPPRTPFSLLPRKCCLCPRRRGAYIRTSDNEWIHSFCAFWTPECKLIGNRVVFGLDKIQTERFRGKCGVCNWKEGVTVQCASEGCSAVFHPICGRLAGYGMNLTGQVHLKRNHGENFFQAFCDKHKETAYEMSVDIINPLEHRTHHADFRNPLVTAANILRRNRYIINEVNKSHSENTTWTLRISAFLLKEFSRNVRQLCKLWRAEELQLRTGTSGNDRKAQTSKRSKENLPVT